MMARTIDRIAALEAAFAPSPARLSLCAPVPELTCEQWEAIAMAQQAKLIADAQTDIDRANAIEAARTAAATVGKQTPPPQRKLKPPPPFVHVPSVFDTPARV